MIILGFLASVIFARGIISLIEKCCEKNDVLVKENESEENEKEENESEEKEENESDNITL
jgi:hypothetical protein